MESKQTPTLDFLAVFAKLNNGKVHQVLMNPETRLAIANFIAVREGSIKLEEQPTEGLIMWRRSVPDISKLNRDQVVGLYADFIISVPDDEDVVEFNKLIIEKWSNKALVYIKNKAWKLIETTNKTP